MQTTTTIDTIIEPLDELFRKHGYRNHLHEEDPNLEEDISKPDQFITAAWQKHLMTEDWIKAEVPIRQDAREKIDIVDYQTHTAYEVKVSVTDVNQEFYQALWKVIAYNNNHDEPIKALVFLSEHNGIKFLEQSTLFQETIRLMDSGMFPSQIKITLRAIAVN